MATYTPKLLTAINALLLPIDLISTHPCSESVSLNYEVINQSITTYHAIDI